MFQTLRSLILPQLPSIVEMTNAFKHKDRLSIWTRKEVFCKIYFSAFIHMSWLFHQRKRKNSRTWTRHWIHLVLESQIPVSVHGRNKLHSNLFGTHVFWYKNHSAQECVESSIQIPKVQKGRGMLFCLKKEQNDLHGNNDPLRNSVFLLQSPISTMNFDHHQLHLDKLTWTSCT